MPTMFRPDRLIGDFVHMKDEHRADEALHMLKKIASMVKPLMRARGWHVGKLVEFYPPIRGNQTLLGLNYDKGREICLRLRHPRDRRQFIPFEQILDTMLHELVHIVRGPHDDQFNRLWDQLRDEMQSLLNKGYTGESFLSEGRRLGGTNVPDDELRRLVRQAADDRRIKHAGTAPGRRLGGAAPRPGQDIRRTIADAADRRRQVLRGCAEENLTPREMQEMADRAAHNGFRTQAEEDEANEAAISQALWELVQEDEKKRLGDAYLPPSDTIPEEYRRGLASSAQSRGGIAEPQHPTMHPATSSNMQRRDPTSSMLGSWACETCTLQNPLNYLCCDACGLERPQIEKRRVEHEPSPGTSKPPVIDLTSSPPKGKAKARHVPLSQPSVPPIPSTWICKSCGMEVERQWWSCMGCGWVKDNSK
ncbi:WLM domain-containing protein [Purpureocillium lavendulum]|uniref:WLM domain-containing protein n=1 Tax=Purpureocillium lavendulum TaxID=1247861 RepID=A0AB34FV71_9HYPO|nr:WLM domain-containing protein [Purpureocillium lavendulum]